jgi:hypothetical protein
MPLTFSAVRDLAARREQFVDNLAPQGTSTRVRPLVATDMPALAGLSVAHAPRTSVGAPGTLPITPKCLRSTRRGRLLKQEETGANAGVRRSNAATRSATSTSEVTAIFASGSVLQPEPVPFRDELQAVLAGPLTTEAVSRSSDQRTGPRDLGLRA